MQNQPLAAPIIARNAFISGQTRFRRVFAGVNPASIEQLDSRRERQVYLLTNGKRAIDEIAGLLGIAPIEVAFMMKHLFEQGHVEFAPFDENEMDQAVYPPIHPSRYFQGDGA